MTVPILTPTEMANTTTKTELVSRVNPTINASQDGPNGNRFQLLRILYTLTNGLVSYDCGGLNIISPRQLEIVT